MAKFYMTRQWVESVATWDGRYQGRPVHAWTGAQQRLMGVKEPSSGWIDRLEGKHLSQQKKKQIEKLCIEQRRKKGRPMPAWAKSVSVCRTSKPVRQMDIMDRVAP